MDGVLANGRLDDAANVPVEYELLLDGSVILTDEFDGHQIYLSRLQLLALLESYNFQHKVIDRRLREIGVS